MFQTKTSVEILTFYTFAMLLQRQMNAYIIRTNVLMVINIMVKHQYCLEHQIHCPPLLQIMI